MNELASLSVLETGAFFSGVLSNTGDGEIKPPNSKNTECQLSSSDSHTLDLQWLFQNPSGTKFTGFFSRGRTRTFIEHVNKNIMRWAFPVCFSVLPH